VKGECTFGQIAREFAVQEEIERGKWRVVLDKNTADRRAKSKATERAGFGHLLWKFPLQNQSMYHADTFYFLDLVNLCIHDRMLP